MSNHDLVIQAQLMVHQALGANQLPVVFLMNTVTRQAIGDTIRETSKPTFWSELRRRIMFRPLGNLITLHGIPVAVNDHLPDGMLSLQLAPNPDILPQEALRGLSGYRGKEEETEARETERGAQDTAFVEKGPVSDETEGGVTLKELSKGIGSVPIPTDILIKSLEGVDDIKQVIVVRVHRNNDVTMCMNCNQFEAPGILSKAMIWFQMNS